MGDMSPSEFFNKLASFNATTDMNLLRNLWFGRLPEQLKIKLADQRHQPVKAQLEMADAVYSVMQRGTNQAIYWAQPAQTYVPPPPAFSSAPTVPVQPPVIAELMQCVQQSTLQIDRNDRVQAGRRRQPQKQQRRDRSRPQSRRHPDICYYHQRFGEAAWRCEAPCFLGSHQVNTQISHYIHP